MNLLPVILSGGSGTRLWPLSREQYPKQLLPLVGDESLLQETVRRMDGLPAAAVIPLSAGWSDVGAWDSLWQVPPKDAADNARRGDVMLYETTDTLVTENESTFIPLGTKHQLENLGKVSLEMIEVQSGSYLGEDDIVRFEDHYRRHGK
jgi:mannose-1-phosphate guanylyltransferase